MRKAILLWLLILFGCSPATAQDLAGTYAVVGSNEDGSQYHGRAEVTEDNGLISVQIFDPDGNLMSIAVCLREPGFVVSCIFQTRQGVVGLAAYRLDGDQWLGRWHVPGSAAILTETFTRTDPRLHGAEAGPKSVL